MQRTSVSQETENRSPGSNSASLLTWRTWKHKYICHLLTPLLLSWESCENQIAAYTSVCRICVWEYWKMQAPLKLPGVCHLVILSKLSPPYCTGWDGGPLTWPILNAPLGEPRGQRFTEKLWAMKQCGRQLELHWTKSKSEKDMCKSPLLVLCNGSKETILHSLQCVREVKAGWTLSGGSNPGREGGSFGGKV